MINFEPTPTYSVSAVAATSLSANLQLDAEDQAMQSTFEYNCKYVSLAGLPNFARGASDPIAYAFEIERELRCLNEAWKTYLVSTRGEVVVDLRPYFQTLWRLEELLLEATGSLLDV